MQSRIGAIVGVNRNQLQWSVLVVPTHPDHNALTSVNSCAIE